MTDDLIGRNGELFPTGSIKVRISQAAQEAADRIIANNEQESKRTEIPWRPCKKNLINDEPQSVSLSQDGWQNNPRMNKRCGSSLLKTVAYLLAHLSL